MCNLPGENILSGTDSPPDHNEITAQWVAFGRKGESLRNIFLIEWTAGEFFADWHVAWPASDSSCGLATGASLAEQSINQFVNELCGSGTIRFHNPRILSSPIRQRDQKRYTRETRFRFENF